MEKARGGHYQLACSAAFEGVHRVPEMDVGVSTPLQYYAGGCWVYGAGLALGGGGWGLECSTPLQYYAGGCWVYESGLALGGGGGGGRVQHAAAVLRGWVHGVWGLLRLAFAE